MAISQTAQRNHDALFPDHQSTLKVTDPELIEIFDNWAFDEVIEDAPLDVRLRLMIQLASLIDGYCRSSPLVFRCGSRQLAHCVQCRAG
jgi:hypothetical protein